MSIRSRLWIIPPILLLLVATIQPFLVKKFHLNKWKGGGFAMFSTVDHYSNRFLRARASTSEGELPMFLSDWNDEYLRLICLPNVSQLEKTAAYHDELSWSLIDTTVGPIEALLKAPASPGSRALLRVYGDAHPEDTGLEKSHTQFFVPSHMLAQPTSSVTPIANSKMEAYRLIYKGGGRIAGRKLAESED